MNFTRSLLLLATTLGSVASATVVNIDFNRLLGTGFPTNTYAGLGAAPDNPANTTWNGLNRATSGSGITASGLLNSAGVATSVSINIPPTIGQGSTVGDQELGGAPLTFQDLMFDSISIDSGAAGLLVSKSATIAGLAIGGTYEIYFYSQGDDNNGNNVNDGQNGLFAITSTLGGSVIGTAKQTGYDGVVGGNGTFTEGVEYVKFSATANASGQIFFKWENVVPGVNVTTDNVPNSTNNGSRFSSLNAIQIVQVVPEPSSALLALLGTFGLLARRRR
jgi:hypothetical protein